MLYVLKVIIVFHMKYVNYVDEKQLMYCVKNPCKFIYLFVDLFVLKLFCLDLCGPIRIGIHNLLIALHFEPHIKAR